MEDDTRGLEAFVRESGAIFVPKTERQRALVEKLLAIVDEDERRKACGKRDAEKARHALTHITW